MLDGRLSPMRVLAALGFAIMFTRAAEATTLRVVSYNIDSADQSSDSNIIASYAGVPTVLQAIGQHHIGTNAQPLDVMGVEELTSTTLSNLVTTLNGIYGAGTYAYDHTTDPNTGGGPDGIVYNTKTVQVISARSVGDGAFSGAVGAAVGATVPRSPMVYQLRPVGYGSNADFYMYVSHARSTSDNSTGSARYMEAQEIRNDANTKLPANAHIMYSGDFNLFNGNNANGTPNGANAENAYLCLTGQTTSDGINWAGATRGFDPTSPTTNTTTWKNSDTSGASNYLYTDSSTSLTSRLDMELVSGAMLNQPGIQLATDTSDPFTNGFPSSKYPYAYEVFGNNGTTNEGTAINGAGNTALSDLANASAVLNALKQFNSSNQFVGSDHLPLVADYNVVGVAPAARFYVGGVSGAWSSIASWSASDGGASGASVPIIGTPVTVDPSANAAITFDGNYTGAGIAELHLNGKAGATATLNQSANAMVVSGAISLGESADTRGAYNVSGGTLTAATILLGSSAGGIGTMTISGAGSVTVASIQINAGGQLNYNGGTFAPGSVTLSGGGQMSMAAGHNKVLVASALSVDTSSQLDVTDNKVIVRDSVNHATTFATLQNDVIYGSTHPAGITSTALPANTALAVIDNGALATPFTTFGGQSVDSNSILIAPELLGDANVDGHVDLTDLSIVLNDFGSSTLNWTSGNFDGAATIDLTDLSDVLNQFGASFANASEGVPMATFGAAAAPEPASLAGLLLAVPALLKRRVRMAQ